MMAWDVKILRNGVQAVVVGWYGYEAVQKMLVYDSYATWCHVLPWIGRWAPLVAFMVVVAEILIVMLVLLGRPRTGMWCALWGTVAFTAFQCAGLLAGWFYLPFDPWWPGMTWFSKMVVALMAGWGSWWWISQQADQKKRLLTTL